MSGLRLRRAFPKLLIVKATIQSNGEVTIPAAIRERLGLQPGQVLEFDEKAPFLKAVPALDAKPMGSMIGRFKEEFKGKTSAEWLEEMRGPVE